MAPMFPVCNPDVDTFTVDGSRVPFLCFWRACSAARVLRRKGKPAPVRDVSGRVIA